MICNNNNNNNNNNKALWANQSNSAKSAAEVQHIQKAWDRPVAANHRALLLARAFSDVDTARLFPASSPHSGDWLHAPPITAVGLRLSDYQMRPSGWQWLTDSVAKSVNRTRRVYAESQYMHVDCMDCPAARVLPDNSVAAI